MKSTMFAAAICLIGCDPMYLPDSPYLPDDTPVEEGAPEPEPEPEPEFEPEPPVIVEDLVVEIGVGPCGNGIVNDGEECDCGANGVVAEFCMTPNGDDAWCSTECEAQCTEWDIFPRGTNMCDPPDELVQECSDAAYCRDNIERVTSHRLHAECLDRGDLECDEELAVRLGFVAGWLQDGLEYCAFPGRDPQYNPECHR